MRPNLALVICAAVLPVLAGRVSRSAAADAVPFAPAAVYFPIASCGELVLDGGPSTEFVVWGQDGLGGYAVIGGGALDVGSSTSLWVESAGTDTEAPQFVVQFSGDHGGLFAIDEPGQQWWVE